MRSDKVVLNLRQFMLRQEVLKTYKDILKTCYKIDDHTYRKEIIEWTRHDFKMNKHLSDETGIKISLTRAKMSLKELTTSIDMAK
ncbi:LYR motif-containing 2 [Brachionus plicatilis]|uniref:LYR motif-containing protein 2 n=1 Tax=Brachionus plicatilis TaxID=10195 RepID=A0A3M7RGD0_BRAPC|nr:LYR motif-containing 2 [Brachionus plicatilis]